MQHKRVNYPLTLITALLLIMIAGLTGSTLVVLRRMHGKSAHNAAAETVIKQGQAMTQKLSTQPAVTSTNKATDWSEFSHLVRNLHSIEDGLQYVSVTRDDLVIFHEQTCRLDGSPALPETVVAQPPAGSVEMKREALHVGDKIIPVVVFSTTLEGPGGSRTSVRVALRKDTVNREERTADNAITSMFRLSLLAVTISFATCVVLVVWMMRREVKREAQRREEEHLAFSGMLANGIVHDFRNPMSSMRLDVQMLQRESGRDELRPERIHKLSERICSTIDRMDKVFQEFLYVSRPDTDKRVTVDIISCIRDSLEMLAPRFERAKLTAEIDSNLKNINVLAYESSLRRALVNVLTNAEQFSPEGATISIAVTSTETSAVIDISDEGPGIPKAKRRKVFEMFETGRPEGTGLGLFIAKAAIERTAGTIEILDNPGGKGARIRITLPLSKRGVSQTKK